MTTYHLLNTRRIQLNDDTVDEIDSIRREIRTESIQRQWIRKYIDHRYPGVQVIKAWETGGMNVVDASFSRQVHIIVRNRDRRTDYEFEGWPYFKLLI